jgi:hypothetical protein
MRRKAEATRVGKIGFVKAPRGYRMLAAALAHFHRFFRKAALGRGFVSLTISGIYLSFEFCFPHIKQAI